MYIERMRAQDYIDKTREYLDYLEEHIENVRKSFCNVSDACKSMLWVGDDFTWHSVRSDVIYHDISKFSVEEFVQYRTAFFSVDEENSKSTLFDSAWDHHKSFNSHHHETAKSYLDIIHMVIDWTAMGYKFGDTAQQYYEANKDRIDLSDEHISFMYEMFDCIERYSK